MMEKLIIGFGKQGYVVTFGLSLNTIDQIKKKFQTAKPILQVTVGYKDVGKTLEPYRKPVTNYVLPLLTGLSKDQLNQFCEVVILDQTNNHKYLSIKQPQPAYV